MVVPSSKSLVEFLESDQSRILFTASSSNITNGGKASLDKLKEMLDMIKCSNYYCWSRFKCWKYRL